MQRALPGTEGAIFPFWSPDGRSIAFFADRKLKRIDLVGDTVQEIADAPIGRGGAWTTDGSILFAPTATGALYRVAASGGQPVAFTTLGPGQNDHRAPVILPGGRHFIFYARGAATGRGVYVANIDGSQPRRLLDAAAAAVYAPSGHLLFARENQLLAQRFDPATLTLSGEPFKVADNVGVNRGVSLATLAASSSGAIAYATAATTRLQFAWFDRSGAEVGRVGTPDTSPVTNPALSPDGRTLAFARLMEGNWDIWLMEMARGVMTRLTSEPNLDFVPVWMTDNTHIIYQSIRGVEPDLYRRAIGSRAELLMKTPGGKVPMDVSRDGRFLLFGSSTSETNTDIWMMPLDGSVPPQPLVETRFVEGGAQFSPDGRWFAYSSNETGRFEIYVRPFTGSGPPRRVSTAGGNLARWSHAGKELFYVAPDGKLMRASMTGIRVARTVGIVHWSARTAVHDTDRSVRLLDAFPVCRLDRRSALSDADRDRQTDAVDARRRSQLASATLTPSISFGHDTHRGAFSYPSVLLTVHIDRLRFCYASAFSLIGSRLWGRQHGSK